MLTHYSKSIIIISIIFFSNISVFGQVNISGPECVIPSVEYQYNISANWKDSSDLQICIQGGILTDSSRCYNGKPISFIRVVWSSESQNNNIKVHSSSGDAIASISITGLLKGGKINLASKMRSVDTLAIPTQINCSAATGGNCAPVYEYQWQQSVNGMAWTNIDGAIEPRLQFLSAKKQTTYYRRKVTEKMTRTEDYSDIAILVVARIKTN